MATTATTTYSATAIFHSETVTVAAVNAGTASISLPIEMTIKPNLFIGYTFVNGSDVPTTPGAGTITFEVKELVNPENKTAVPSGTTVSATAAEITLTMNTCASSVEISGAGITTATNVIIKIMATES